MADPAGTESVATATTDADGRYEVEGVPEGADVVVVVDRDPRLTSVVHSVGSDDTGDVTSATTLAAEHMAAEVAGGGEASGAAFSKTVQRLEDAMDDESGSDLARILEELVPGSFGDGLPGDLPPGLQFLADVAAGADPAVCEALALEQDQATPTTRVSLAGLSQELGEEPGVWIYDAGAKELEPDDRRPGYVERTGDEAGRFFTPVHPTAWMEGGPILVAVFSEDEELTCPGMEMEVLALEPAPGTMESTVDALVADARQVAQDAGYDPQALLQADVRELDPLIMGTAAYLQFLEGPNNPNNVRNLLSGEAPALKGVQVSQEQNDLLDALAAESGLSEALTDASSQMGELASIMQGEKPVLEAAGSSGTGSTAAETRGRLIDLEPPNQPVTPRTLDRLMTVQSGFAAMTAGTSGETLELAKIASGTVSLALTTTTPITGGGGAVLGGLVGVVGNVLTGLGLALDFGEKMLPSLLQDIELEVSPAAFNEDSEDRGEWNAPVVALTDEWTLKWPDLIGTIPVAGPAVGALGKVASYSDEVLELTQRTLEASRGSFQEVWGVSSNSGPLTIGRHPYNVEGGVSPERAGEDDYFSWELETMSSETGKDPVVLVEGAESRYETRDVGESRLRVRTEPGRFAGAHRESHELIEVEAIEVQIVDGEGRPPPFQLSSGEEVNLVAEVDNAQDRSVAWSGGQGEIVSVGGEFDQNATYRAPQADGTYEVTAESVAETGLRADGEPPRIGKAGIIVGSRFAVSSPPPCVEIGDDLEFTATVGGETLPFDEVEATVVSGPGSVSSAGVFTASSEGDVTIRFTYQPSGAEEAETVEVSFRVREFCSYMKLESGQFNHTSHCVQGYGDLGKIVNDAVGEDFEIVLLAVTPQAESLIAEDGEWEKTLVGRTSWGISVGPFGGTLWQGPLTTEGSTTLTVRREIRELGGQEVAVFSGSFSNVAFAENALSGGTMRGALEFRGVPDLSQDPLPPEDYVCKFTEF